MVNVRRSVVLTLAATLATALLSFASPQIAQADFEAPPSPPPSIYAIHASILLQSGTSTNTIDGAMLTAVDNAWNIDVNWIDHDVPVGRGAWAIFRGEQGALVGAPQEGTNFALTHHALLGNATTTLNASFSLPIFGDPDTPSGTYTIVAAELPEIYYEFDEGLGDYTGVERSYTDADLANWFAGLDEANPPADYRSLEFEYIAGEAQIACTENCYSNVLFLPGIQSSRLYRGEEKLWEPFGDEDVEELFLNPDGTSIYGDVYVKEGDVLDELPVTGANVYKSFLEEMDQMVVQGLINDWEPVSYDWRLSLDDILESGKQDGEKIYYTQATSSPYIIQELRRLAASSKSGKVTIVAHSNGGLLAKRLTQVLGEEADDLIDKMIFVAVPQVGTPDALVIAMHGQDFGPFGLAASKQVVRTFASTSPMLYHLLPSADYFTYVDDPVVVFDESLPEWIDAYGDVVHSEERLRAFVTGTYGKAEDPSDTSLPGKLSEASFEEASELHSELDMWQAPAGVEITQIAGWGLPTVSGIQYKRENQSIKIDPKIKVFDGDGRVLVPSSLWISTSAGAHNHWINLDEFNRPSNRISRGYLSKINHASILEVEELRQLISDLILEREQPVNGREFVSDAAPASSENRLRFELHSPLALDLFDANGNHTGVSTTTSEVEENIPGTYYMTFGEQQYIFADSGNTYHLALDGYDSGTFTLIISNLAGDSTVSSTAFENVPVTPQTIVTLTVTTLDSISSLAVDKDGDGDTDFTVSTNGTITEAQDTDQAVSVTPSGGPPVELMQLATSTLAAASTKDHDSATSTQSIGAVNTPLVTEEQVPAKPVVKISSVKTVKQATTAHVPTTTISQANTQVALAGQTTGMNLWSRISQWIISKWVSFAVRNHE